MGKHTISLGLLGAILGILCLGAFAAYVLTISIPVTVQEPIEILGHPEALDLYPGETLDFNITIQNHASVDYALFLDFYLDNTPYQQSYVTTSNETYFVHPGVQSLSSWLKVSANATPLSSALTASFRREAIENYAEESLNITNMNFDVTNRRIVVTANNTGTTSVTINEAWVNSVKQTSVIDDTLANLPVTIGANQGKVFNITLTSMSQGYSYQVKLISSKGNAFLYTGTAPS